jgi:hypothetical protein
VLNVFILFYEEIMEKNIFSYSGFTKSVILTQMTKAFCEQDYDSACYWSVEMHCSGYLATWWSNICFFCAQNIHLRNPKISKFLVSIVHEYPEIGINSIQTLNDAKYRQVIALIAGVCTFSPKDNMNIKLTSFEELHDIQIYVESTEIHSRVRDVAIENDSVFLMQVVTRIIVAIKQNKFHESIRFFKAGLLFEKQKHTKIHMISGKRPWKNLDVAYWNDWVFLLWDSLINFCETTHPELTHVIRSWHVLFIRDYSKSTKKEKIYYIINCIILLTHQIDVKIPCIHNEITINRGCENIDLLYKDVVRQKKI